MCVYHTIYSSTRFKSVANAQNKSKDSSFVEKNGVVYKECYCPRRFAGGIKEFVLSKSVDTAYFGTDYNGYGWTDHHYQYYIPSHAAKTLIAMVEKVELQKKAKKPLVEPEYEEKRIDNPQWATLLKEVEEHNSMYKQKPSIIKNDFEQRIIQTPEWTTKQVDDLIIKTANANSYEELWDCWIGLCKLNASAYKGYRALSIKEGIYNSLVYGNKVVLISKLAEKWASVGGILQHHDGILYITDKNGWQISFHRAPQDALSRAKEAKQNIWSNIICSWSYKDAEEYKEAVITWKQKQDVEDLTRREYEKYASQSLALRNRVVFLLLEDKKIRRYYTKRGYYSSILEWDDICQHQLLLLKKPVDYLIDRFVNIRIA